MDITYHHTFTSSGLSLDVLLSGIQKAARQGHVTEFIWACEQIIDFFCVEQGSKVCKGPTDPKQFKTRVKSIVTNILHRLMVIYLEDVHAAEPVVWPWIEKKMKEIYKFRTDSKQNNSLLLNLKQIGVMLTISRHSRIYSHIRRAVIGKLDAEIPAHLLPIKNWVNDTKVDPPSLSNVDTKWWKREIPPRERWIVSAAASIQNNLLKIETNNSTRLSELETKITTIISQSQIPTSIPTFFQSRIVIDQHTKKGSKNEDNFTFLGSNVVNERFLLPPIFHAYYTSSKISNETSDFVPDIDQLLQVSSAARSILLDGFRESVLLKPEVRAQLTCSASRPDTYFARLWGYPVFVKGPFPPNQAKSVNSQEWIYRNLKTEMDDLPLLKPWVCKMVPDQWPSVPLGSRNSVNKDEPQLFIIWKSLIPHNVWPIPSKMVQSKLWPQTAVVDFPALSAHIALPNAPKMGYIELKSFVLCCAWRYVAAIPDNAERNFVWVIKEEAVYSLDEDNPFRETGPSPFRFEKTKKAAILAFIDKNFDDIALSLAQWSNVFASVSSDKSPYELKSSLDRLKSVQTKEGLKAIYVVETKPRKKTTKKRKDSEESSSDDDDDELEEEESKKPKISEGKQEQ